MFWDLKNFQAHERKSFVNFYKLLNKTLSRYLRENLFWCVSSQTKSSMVKRKTFVLDKYLLVNTTEKVLWVIIKLSEITNDVSLHTHSISQAFTSTIKKVLLILKSTLSYQFPIFVLFRQHSTCTHSPNKRKIYIKKEEFCVTYNSTHAPRARVMHHDMKIPTIHVPFCVTKQWI